VAALLTLAAAAPLAAQQAHPEIVIGGVIDGPAPRYRELLPLFEQEIEDLVGDRFRAGIDERFLRTADWTAAGVRAAIDDLLANPEVDMVVGFGVLASHDLAVRPPPPKPVFGTAVLDPDLQDLPELDGTSGVHNLNYIAIPFTFETDLEALTDILPVRQLAVLMSEQVVEAIPSVRTAIEARTGTEGFAMTVVVASNAAEALGSIPDGTDAVYVLPLQDWRPVEVDALIAGLIERRLPSFARLDAAEVDRGFLATRTPAEFFERLARRLALNIQSVLLGEDAGSLRTSFSPPDRLIINMATARAVGVYPPFTVLTEAELIHERDRPLVRTVDLAQVMREALQVNLDLASADRGVEAGAKDIDRSRSRLLPELDLSSTGTIIDEDRAAASFGQQPQRALTGGATLSQLLFSESAWADLSIQHSLQEARRHDRDAVALDVSREAGLAYVDVVRAKTLERIRQENVRLTRTNLENARLRVRIGTGRPAEVLRWENQLAVERQAVIDASAARNLAEMQLNRVLQRPAEQPFGTVPSDDSDPMLRVMERLRPYVDDPWSFRVLRTFLAAEARREAPELRTIEALIAARERSSQAASRSFWLPTLALQAGLTERLASGGAGSKGLAIPLPTGFPEVDDTSWSLSLRASLPLFQGGRRSAERQQADLETQRLRIEHQATGDRIEQRLRSALHRTGASWANVRLSSEAADAARQNFDLVSEAYAEGAATILDLLDAQNAYLVAELAAGNANYDFLADFIDVQRAAGHYLNLSDDAYVDDLLLRLDEFMTENAP
jgi:outer membrane protein TolC